MGNSPYGSQGFPVVRPSRPGEWVVEGNTGYCDIVRNTTDGTLADMYSTTRDGRIPLAEDYRRYNYRLTQNNNLVQVLQVEKENASHMCQGAERLRIKTERIPLRLSEVSNLPLNQGLYVLHESLVGFQSINQYNGPVNITDEMIGFNTSGKVRVWLNENFSKNLAETGSQIFNARRNQPRSIAQTVMISQLFEIVERHIQGGLYPQQLKSAYAANPPSTFVDALNLIKGFTANSNIQVPGRVSVISSQASVVGATPSVLSQPGQITSTITTTQQLQSTSQPSVLISTTDNTTNSPLNYTHNPTIHHQLQHGHIIPHQPVSIHPDQQTIIPQVPFLNNVVTTIPTRAGIYNKPQSVATQRQIVQSISPQPYNIVNQSIVTSKQHIEEIAVSRTPIVNVVPASNIRSNIVQNDVHLGTQVLRVPEIRQSTNVQSAIQYNRSLPQRPSFHNLNNVVVNNGNSQITAPVVAVQTSKRVNEVLGPITTTTSVREGAHLLQHLNKNNATSPKTITAINNETVHKFERNKPRSGSTVQVVHGGTSATSTLHTHIYEGKTIVNSPTHTIGVSHPVEKAIIQTQTNTLQPIKAQQPEWFVTRQSNKQSAPLKPYLALSQPTVQAQTISFTGLPHRQIHSVPRHIAPATGTTVVEQITTETVTVTGNAREIETQYTTLVEESSRNGQQVTITEQTDTITENVNQRSLFEIRPSAHERNQIQISYEVKENPRKLHSQQPVIVQQTRVSPTVIQQHTTTLPTIVQGTVVESRPILLKQSLPVIRTAGVPVIQQNFVVEAPRVTGHVVQQIGVDTQQVQQHKVVEQVVTYQQTEVYENGRLVEQYEQIDYQEQDEQGNVYEEREIIEKEIIETGYTQTPQISYQQTGVRRDPQVGVIRHEPRVIRTEPQVIRIEPQVIRAQPHIIRAGPQVIRAEPAHVYIRQPEVIRIEPTVVYKQPEVAWETHVVEYQQPSQQTQIVYRTQPKQQYEEVEYREVEYMENEAGDSEVVYEHEHRQYQQNGEYVVEDEYVQVVREEPESNSNAIQHQQQNYPRQQAGHVIHHEYQRSPRVVAEYSEQPRVAGKQYYVITDSQGNEVGGYQHEEVDQMIYDQSGQPTHVISQNDELVYEQNGQIVHEHIQTVDYQDQQGEQHHVQEVVYDVEEGGVLQKQYYQRTEEVEAGHYQQQPQYQEYYQHQRQQQHHAQAQAEHQYYAQQQQAEHEQYKRQEAEYYRQQELQQQQEEAEYYRQQELQQQYQQQQQQQQQQHYQHQHQHQHQGRQVSHPQRMVATQPGQFEYVEYDQEPANYEEEVAVIVQEDGQPVGYEIHQTAQYDTREGEHVTVEEDYQVIYGEGQTAEVQYTHIETHNSTVPISSLSSARPVTLQEDGVRYSNSNGGSGYRHVAYQPTGVSYTSGITSHVPSAYEYNYKPTESIHSTLVGSHNQYATSPSSGMGIRGLSDSNNYVSSSLNFAGSTTSSSSNVPNYMSYQPNYQPLSINTPSTSYQYSSSYRPEQPITTTSSSRYDYLAGPSSAAYTNSKYDYTSSASAYERPSDYSTGVSAAYGGAGSIGIGAGVTGSFSRPTGTNITPTYDFLSRELREGAYNSLGNRDYISGIVGSSGITGGVTTTSIGSHPSYTSTMTSSLPSYDTLRTNLLSNQFGISVPEYISQTTVETVPLEGGIGIMTTKTEEYARSGGYGHNEYTSYNSSHIVTNSETYKDYGF